MHIIKRSGERVLFDSSKIYNAIEKANNAESILSNRLSDESIKTIVAIVEDKLKNLQREATVEEIQDLVENELFSRNKNVFLLYHDYRFLHTEKRKLSSIDKKLESITEVGVDENGTIGCKNESVKSENSNKNPTVLSVQRDYIAGEMSKYYSKKYKLPLDIQQAHNEGILHFHDLDFFIHKMHNCDLINLEDMLMNGTSISGTKIDKPKSFATACTVTSQIVSQVASSQYGGQSFSLAHLVPFVDISRKKTRKRLSTKLKEQGISISDEKLTALTEELLKYEIEGGIQTIQYQLITLQTTNGQSPFVTTFMYLNEVEEGQARDDLAMLIEEMLTQRIKGVKNRKGAYVTPAFPKLIYVLQEDNIREGSKYWYLTELAAKCTAKRLVPDYVSEKVMLQLKGDVYPPMGCRSFLTPDRFTDEGKFSNVPNALNYKEGKHKYYGRFNQGVVTINLVDVALSSQGNIDDFWQIMNDRLELCHKALRLRHERLLGTPSDVAPILWQDGAIARLKSGETIDKLLFNGYSTISLGYAGLAECVRYMIGESHTEEKGKVFGMKVMQMLNDYCAKWKEAENIDYSVYGTPLESTTYKFAKCLQKRFGKIKGITDKNYITNSYHVHVTEEIDAFSKLAKEAEFQKLSPGGAISYIEVPDMKKNISAVLDVIKFMYDTILYAEINTKSDYCDVCGFDGEIQIQEKDGRLIWVCPNCGNTDQTKLNVARRTCGYIGTQYWNQGRTQEIKDRVLHL